MYDSRAAIRPMDVVWTFGAIWLALILAGSVTDLATTRIQAAIGSLSLYVGLLALYAFVAPPGRRSGPSFFAAAFLYPIFALLWLIALARPGVAEWVWIPMAGLNVGPVPRGGPDAPIDLYLPFWMINLIVPVIAVLGVRAFIRYRRDD